MKIKIYSIPLCGECQEVKKYLDDHGIVYEDHDLHEIADLDTALATFAKRPEGLDELLAIHVGFQANDKVAPVIIVDGHWMTFKRLKRSL